MEHHAVDQLPELADIVAAKRRINDVIRTTPVLTDPVFNQLLGCELWLKCENLQRTGAFKFRGASNAIARLGERGRTGDVATHSSGNHGAALALAASSQGRKSWIVMPDNSVKPKVEAVRRNGGEVVFCPPTGKDREAGLAKLVEQGCIPVLPFDDFNIICGQGTATLELAQQCPDLDIIIAPIGGGGLISGTAIASKALNDKVTVIGVEPEGAADTALSMQLGERVLEYKIETIADGLRTIVGVLNFEIIRNNVSKVITVTESGIVDGMALVWQYFRLLIEPSSATVIAAVLSNPEEFAGRRVGAIISGGNVDLSKLPFNP